MYMLFKVQIYKDILKYANVLMKFRKKTHFCKQL